MTDLSGMICSADQLQNGYCAAGVFDGSPDLPGISSIVFAPDSIFSTAGQKIVGYVGNCRDSGVTRTFTYDGFFTAPDGSPAYVFSHGALNASSIAVSVDGSLSRKQAGRRLDRGDAPPPVATCFLAGVMIATPAGEIPVEHLAVGDLICTRRNNETTARPITWIGSRSITLDSDASRDAFPVRIRAGAFAPLVPCRDLLVTREHCILVDGTLVPARMLVNGSSILVDQTISRFTYYHIELETHAILVADGLETESYLDTGKPSRGSDWLHATPHPLSRSRFYRRWSDDAAAPLAVDRRTVEPIWTRLAERARCLGFDGAPAIVPMTDKPDLRLLLENGRELSGRCQDGRRHAFRIPERIRPIRLLSRAARPADSIGPFVNDRRMLGVAIEKLVVWDGRADRIFPVHGFDLAGWHSLEGTVRWTNGSAAIDLPAAEAVTMLDVHVAAVMLYRDDRTSHRSR